MNQIRFVRFPFNGGYVFWTEFEYPTWRGGLAVYLSPRGYSIFDYNRGARRSKRALRKTLQAWRLSLPRLRDISYMGLWRSWRGMRLQIGYGVVGDVLDVIGGKRVVWTNGWNKYYSPEALAERVLELTDSGKSNFRDTLGLWWEAIRRGLLVDCAPVDVLSNHLDFYCGGLGRLSIYASSADEVTVASHGRIEKMLVPVAELFGYEMSVSTEYWYIQVPREELATFLDIAFDGVRAGPGWRVKTIPDYVGPTLTEVSGVVAS